LDLPPSDSAIVSVDVPDAEALLKGGMTASVRAGRARLSFFVYNAREDADRAADLLGGTDGRM
jgi:hypothetical protein